MYISQPLFLHHASPLCVTHPAWKDEAITRKTDSIWRRVQQWIGGFIRDQFFLPLFQNLSQKHQTLIEKERVYCVNFWDKNHPAFIDTPDLEEIRSLFILNEVRKVSIECHGRSLYVEYRIISTEEKQSEDCYTFVHVLGNLSKLDNNIKSTYPFLSSYVKSKEAQKRPIQFILLSQYHTFCVEDQSQYKPTSLEEGGLILCKVLLALQQEMGVIDHLVAHSIGCMMLTAAFKYLTKVPDRIPSRIFLDRGAYSVYDLSLRYFGGRALYPLAILTNWAADLGKEVEQFAKRHHSPDRPLYLIAASQDHIFSGQANLASSPHIQTLIEEKVIRFLQFELLGQCYSASMAHGIGYHLLGKSDLVRGKSFIDLAKETLADAILQKQRE